MPTLKDLREEAGLTATELAAKSHMAYTTFMRIEAGVPTTRVYIDAVLVALSKLLGREITLDDVQGIQAK